MIYAIFHEKLREKMYSISKFIDLEHPMTKINIPDDFSIDIDDVETEEHDRPQDNLVWADQAKLIMKTVGERAMAYQFMHEQDAVRNNKIHNRVKYTDIVLKALVATLSGSTFINLISTTEVNRAALITLVILQLIMAITMGILEGIKQEGNFFEDYNKHLKLATLNGHLVNKTKVGLVFEDKTNCKEMIAEMITQFEDYKGTHPHVSESALNKYIKLSRNTQIRKPLITGDFDTVQIVVERPPDPNTEDDTDIQADYEIRRFLGK